MNNIPISQIHALGAFTISLCIATHERAFLLAPTLDAIVHQTRLPDEIVISDSSVKLQSEHAVNLFRQANPSLLVNYVKTECRALPWHRWNGFQHSKGDIVVFMDDDIFLMPDALAMLEKAYCELATEYDLEHIAGVGFYTFLDDGTEKLRRPNSFEEHWLGIVHAPSASITPGGIGVPPKEMFPNTLIEVGRLSGGGMSFRRDVLKNIGRLDGLIDLFKQGIGPSEDTVLSFYARKFGKLFMLTYPLLTHPNDERAVHTVDARNGWRKGVMETWGRSHTMRWIAKDMSAYRQDWFRVATLEVLRSMRWGIICQPWAVNSWTRFLGALYGFFLGFFFWKRISESAQIKK
jgi:glycosyltransferase involved in cell wall biosynthesis